MRHLVLATGTTDRAHVMFDAAAFSGEAPSLHNSQPWRWRIRDGVMTLMLEKSRVLAASDPDARLATLSCGAALHHARLHLAAVGWHVTVLRLPDPADTTTLAEIRLTDRSTPDPQAARLVRAAAYRHTDRRTTPSAPLDYDKLRTLTTVIAAEGAQLRLLRPEQVFRLAEAADQARRVEADDVGWQVELSHWVGGDRLKGVGIPSASLPPDPLVITAPGLALRRAGVALITESRHHASVFGVLSSTGDGPDCWLRAGEALSAGWLTATDLAVSILPLSVVVEVASSRESLQRLIGADEYPHLVLRFAAADLDDVTGPRTPRLASGNIVE